MDRRKKVLLQILIVEISCRLRWEIISIVSSPCARSAWKDPLEQTPLRARLKWPYEHAPRPLPTLAPTRTPPARLPARRFSCPGSQFAPPGPLWEKSRTKGWVYHRKQSRMHADHSWFSSKIVQKIIGYRYTVGTGTVLTYLARSSYRYWPTGSGTSNSAQFWV